MMKNEGKKSGKHHCQPRRLVKSYYDLNFWQTILNFRDF